MNHAWHVGKIVAIAIILPAVLLAVGMRLRNLERNRPEVGKVIVQHDAIHDVSPPLSTLRAPRSPIGLPARVEPGRRFGAAPENPGFKPGQGGTTVPAAASVPARGEAIEQTTQGSRPPAVLLDSFDGLGVGFTGPQGSANVRNPSDNSLAVGPDHIVEIVNSRMAVYTKKGAHYDSTGKVLFGAAPTNTLFAGFGGRCEQVNNGDAVT